MSALSTVLLLSLFWSCHVELVEGAPVTQSMFRKISVVNSKDQRVLYLMEIPTQLGMWRLINKIARKLKIPNEVIAVTFADFDLKFEYSDQRKLSDLYRVAWLDNKRNKNAIFHRIMLPAEYRLRFFDVRERKMPRTPVTPPSVTDYLNEWTDRDHNHTHRELQHFQPLRFLA